MRIKPYIGEGEVKSLQVKYLLPSLGFRVQKLEFKREIRKERNFFVHNVFKDDLFTKAFQDNPKQYIPRLQELIAKMHVANNELVKIFAEMKKEVKMIY